MNIVKILFALVAAVALSGCIVSEEPLIGPGDAVFPFQSISYREAGGGEVTEMVHEGNSYVIKATGTDPQTDIRFKELGGDLYLAQLSSEQNGKISILYAVLKVDLGKKTAESYMALSNDAAAGPGLRECGDDDLCIDDLDAYLTLARSAIESGDAPDATYEIVETQ